jgi:arsenite methyltransferase
VRNSNSSLSEKQPLSCQAKSRGEKMEKEKTQKIVREAYGKIAQEQEGCGCGTCGPDTKTFAKSIGYSEEELKIIPVEANLALSCGNPTVLASLRKSEVVLDLGSGAGFDCFLAASKVGPNGKVIGVDMTPEMIEKARENAKKNGVKNVEFRLGEIENLPVADNSVDVVISNCVINLSADKPKVFQEVCRVLKPGGRIAISDIALLKELPKKMQESIEAYVGCVGGAILIDEYKRIVESSGLKDVRIAIKRSSACIDHNTKDPIGRAILDGLGENESLEGYVVSVYAEGYK